MFPNGLCRHLQRYVNVLIIYYGSLSLQGSAPPINGVLVFGLYIDGARWDVGARALSDALPGHRFSQLPQVHFIPNAVSEAMVLFV